MASRTARASSGNSVAEVITRLPSIFPDPDHAASKKTAVAVEGARHQQQQCHKALGRLVSLSPRTLNPSAFVPLSLPPLPLTARKRGTPLPGIDDSTKEEKAGDAQGLPQEVSPIPDDGCQCSSTDDVRFSLSCTDYDRVSTWLKEVDAIDSFGRETSASPSWEVSVKACKSLASLAEVLPSQGPKLVVAALLEQMMSVIFMPAANEGQDSAMAKERSMSGGSGGSRALGRTWWRQLEPRPLTPCHPVVKHHHHHGLDTASLTVSSQTFGFEGPERQQYALSAAEMKKRRVAHVVTFADDGGSRGGDADSSDLHDWPETYSLRCSQLQYLTRRNHEWASWLHNLIATKSEYEATTHSLMSLQNIVGTCASMYWIFSLWHAYVVERRLQCRQFASIRRRSDIQLQDLILKWREVIVEAKMHKLEDELHDRRVELKLLGGAHGDLHRDCRETQRQLVHVGALVEESREELGKAQGRRQALQDTWDKEEPEKRRMILLAVMKAVLEALAHVGSLDGVLSRRLAPLHDLATKVVQDIDTLDRLSRLRVDELLVRWVNNMISELKYSAMDFIDNANREQVAEFRGVWSPKETQAFKRRCLLVRAVNPVDSVKMVASDPALLVAMHAYLRAEGHGEIALSPVDLWPLDERADDAKLDAVCSCLKLQVPSRAARCALRGPDLQQDTWVLRPILAAMCHHSLVVKESILRKKQIAQPFSQAPVASMSSLAALPDINEQDLLDLFGQALHALQLAAGPFVENRFKDPGHLLKESEGYTHLSELPIGEVLQRWGVIHTGMEYTDFRDGRFLLLLLFRVAPDIVAGLPGAPSNLLKHTRTPSSPTITGSRRTRHGSDLSPSALSATWQSGPGHEVSISSLKASVDRLDVQDRINIILACGERCVEPFMLTAQAILDNDEEMILAFMAGVFVVRPSLGFPRPALQEQVDFLEEMVKSGFGVVDAGLEGDKKIHSFRSFCEDLHEHHKGLMQAVNMIVDAGKTMHLLEDRMERFGRKAYARRAADNPLLGEPGAAGARKGISTLRMAMSEILRTETWQQLTKHEDVKVRSDSVRAVCSSYAQAIADLFSRYSIRPCPQHPPRVPLEGVLRLYRDCRLRCPCMYLALHEGEEVYHEVQALELPTILAVEALVREESQFEKAEVPQQRSRSKNTAYPDDLSAASTAGLKLSHFVLWILRVARRRHGTALDKDGQDLQAFDEGLKQIFRNHLKAYAHILPEDNFDEISVDVEVRKLLMMHEQVLLNVFEAYADSSQAPPPERSDLPSGERKRAHRLPFSAFLALLDETGQLTGLLDRAAVKRIVAECMQRGGNIGEPARCAASEMVRGIVANKGFRGLSTTRAKLMSLHGRGSKRWVDALVRVSTCKSRKKSDEHAGRRSSPEAGAGCTKHGGGDVALGLSLTFHEFLEALVACSYYRCPSPFLQASERVDHFLKEDFLRNLPRRFQTKATMCYVQSNDPISRRNSAPRSSLLGPGIPPEIRIQGPS